jgi:formiminoglutamase
MFDTNYKTADKTIWQGRIDSYTNYAAFRWHQCIKFLDLRSDSLEPFSGKLGFAFIGFCCDEGIKRNKGRSGAIRGPECIRKELAPLPCWFKKEVELYDAGDIICENITLEECQALLSKAIKQILSLNLFPIVLGGGHEVAFGNFKGLLDYLTLSVPKPNVGIINFDAHFDLRPYENGSSSGTMFRQIADLCSKEALLYSYLCIGIQKHSNTPNLFKTADKLGVKYITAKDIKNINIETIIENIDEFIINKDHLYITICADVFASAYAPGVSACQSLGLHPESVLTLLEHILKADKSISFDIAEVSPRYDQDNITADLASVMIFSVINTLCQIKDLAIFI